MEILLALIIGLAVGVIATVLVTRSRSGSDQAVLRERLSARDSQSSQQQQKIEDQESSLATARETITALTANEGVLKTRLADEQKQAAEKLAAIDDAQNKFSDAFKALAAESLKDNNESFLKLAQQKLESQQRQATGELEKRQTAIDNLLKPMEKSLKAVDDKLGEVEKSRVESYTELKTQVESLGKTHQQLRQETANLVQALRKPNVRGRWGEIQLKRVVELAGMVDHCDFFEQVSVNTEDGRLRPDLQVCLPGGKTIIIDAKTPLEAFIDAVESNDELKRHERYLAHARHVREHVTALSRKSYHEQFEHAPEFVVLFLPGETFFNAALEHDPSLIEVGAENNVIIATPTTLIALLRAVAYGWRQERLADSAQAISELGKELYKRMNTLAEHIAKIGKGLSSATKAYNSSVSSLESRVLVTARKFEELGVTGSDEMTRPEPVEELPRQLAPPVPESATEETPEHKDDSDDGEFKLIGGQER
ncbi:MAG: DNA recombination protein RmuC [Pirellulales bacterium]|nr:DNA recombination protein RmuC [Pirellulales bacterium]